MPMNSSTSQVLAWDNEDALAIMQHLQNSARRAPGARGPGKARAAESTSRELQLRVAAPSRELQLRVAARGCSNGSELQL